MPIKPHSHPDKIGTLSGSQLHGGSSSGPLFDSVVNQGNGRWAPIVNQNRGLGLILARRDHWLGERWLNAATWTSNLHLRCPIPNTDATHYTLRDIVWYCVVLHDIPQHRCHSLRERSYHRDPAIKDDQQSFYGTGEQIGKGCNERAAPEMIYTKADPLNFKLL